MRGIIRSLGCLLAGLAFGGLLGAYALNEQAIKRQKFEDELRIYNAIHREYEREREELTAEERSEDEWFREHLDQIRVREENEQTARVEASKAAEEELEKRGVSIPLDVIEYCEAAGEKYSISPELLEAMCWVESRCTPTAVNGSCKGIMQISEGCHRKRMKKLGVESIWDAQGNIMIGADYLAELLQEYNDEVYATMAYNGDKRAKHYAEQGKMSAYTRKILEISELLEVYHGK